MKIISIDNEFRTSDKDMSKLRRPTYKLIVSMTQEEYKLCCFALERDKREKEFVEASNPFFRPLNKKEE